MHQMKSPIKRAHYAVLARTKQNYCLLLELRKMLLQENNTLSASTNGTFHVSQFVHRLNRIENVVFVIYVVITFNLSSNSSIFNSIVICNILNYVLL